MDCLTDECIIEVDFSNKWARSIGQSLYYAHITGGKKDDECKSYAYDAQTGHP